MASKERGGPSAHYRYRLPSSDIIDADPYASSVRRPHDGFATFEALPPRHEVMEQKLSAQQAEIEKLAIENRRLASTHVILRQDLATAKQELQFVNDHMASFKSEKEQDKRVLMDTIAKMECELAAAEPIKAEFQKARSEAHNLLASRQELISRVQRLSHELEMAFSDAQQIPPLMAELDSLRQEYQRCRFTYDSEMKLYNDHLGSLQVMEKNYMEMSREVNNLRTQLNKISSSSQYNESYPVWNYAPSQNATVAGQLASVTAPTAVAGTEHNPPHFGWQSGSYGSATSYDGISGAYNAYGATHYDPQRWHATAGYDAQKGHAAAGYDAQKGHAAIGYDSHRSNHGPSGGYQKAQTGPVYDANESTAPANNTQIGTGRETRMAHGYEAQGKAGYDAPSRPITDTKTS